MEKVDNLRSQIIAIMNNIDDNYDRPRERKLRTVMLKKVVDEYIATVNYTADVEIKISNERGRN
jgi:hypothetical protein